MDEKTVNTVKIGVNIEWQAEIRRYVWTYEGDRVEPATGNFTLPAGGRTAIVYQLDDVCTNEYELIYVNLDPEACATHQIEHVHVHHKQNAITIIDRNDGGYTQNTPFSLRLLARMRNKIAAGFISSDPQVINNPNTQGPP
jgi:hypothetical protein